MPDIVGDLTKVVRKLSRENERMRRLLSELLEVSKPSGSGGYWADFGPVTYTRMAEFSGEHIDGCPSPEGYDPDDAGWRRKT